jgi:DnaJ family protein A protein 2
VAGQEVNTTEYYELLEITKDATTEQIKKAFRKRALKEHPDKGGDPHKFKRLKEAYDTLLDPEKRQLYDEYGEEGVNNGGPPLRGSANPFDFINRRDKGPKKSKPKLVKIDVTLEEVYAGTTKEVKVTRFRVCTDCEGKGGVNSKPCADCKGLGAVYKMVQVGPGMFTQRQTPCEKCNQLGAIFEETDRCKGCDGKRLKETEKTIEVAIEQGVPDSHDYIFYGESDEFPGALAGDVYVRINFLPHEVFERRGADLIHHKEITLLEALTGVTTTVHHLDGKEYLIATAPGEIL